MPLEDCPVGGHTYLITIFHRREQLSDRIHIRYHLFDHDRMHPSLLGHMGQLSVFVFTENLSQEWARPPFERTTQSVGISHTIPDLLLDFCDSRIDLMPFGDLHAKEFRRLLQEEPLYPRRHCVSARSSVMKIQSDNVDPDG